MSAITFTGTDSYTEADVKAVMQNTHEDIIGFANRQFITYDVAKDWIEDITFLLNEKVLKFFELQLFDSEGTNFKSYKYTVSSSGYLSSGSPSGGINYWAIQTGTKVKLFGDIDYSLVNSAYIKDEINRRGWGNGVSLVGNVANERDYISNNLKLSRSVITK
jgi:hypothetical protein